jgi:hypothetical protein
MATPVIVPDPAEAATPALNPIQKSRFDPASLRIDQGYATGAVTRTSPITARKPDKHNWFRAHNDPSNYHLETLALDIKADRELYLVKRELHAELGLELVPRLLVPCITRQHNVFIWPVTLPDATGRSNPWTETALDAVRAAMDGWVRVVANMEAGGYDVYHPHATNIDPPEWPDLTLEDMLAKAFKNNYIASMDHPLIRRLRGEF